MSRAVDSTARAMAGEALSRLDNGGSGSGGTTVDAYSKLETDNLLNAKVDDVEFSPIKALAESNEINITYLANNKAEKTEVNALSELVADIDSEVDLKANKADVYTKAETNTAISDKVAEIVANAPEDFDTLKEMSDWIDSLEESASAMNTAIKQNTSDIANLKATDETTATEIASVKSDVAINRTTLGVQCKNLYKPAVTGNTIFGAVNYSLLNGKIILSGTPSWNGGVPLCEREIIADKDLFISGWETLENISYIVQLYNPSTGNTAYESIPQAGRKVQAGLVIKQIYVQRNASHSGEVNASIIPMVRYVDTSDTFEEYKPSLQEQITTNTTDISAILARVEALETALASQEA